MSNIKGSCWCWSEPPLVCVSVLLAGWWCVPAGRQWAGVKSRVWKPEPALNSCVCGSGSTLFPACRCCLSDLLWGECCLCCLCNPGTGVSSYAECWASAVTLSGEFPAEFFRVVTLWWMSQHPWSQTLVGLCAPRAEHGPGPSLGTGMLSFLVWDFLYAFGHVDVMLPWEGSFLCGFKQ